MCPSMCHPMYPAMCPFISLPHIQDAQIRANIDKNAVFRKLIFISEARSIRIRFIRGRIRCRRLLKLLRVKHPGCGQCAIDSVNGRGNYSAGIAGALSAREKTRDIRALESAVLPENPDRR